MADEEIIVRVTVDRSGATEDFQNLEAGAEKATEATDGLTKSVTANGGAMGILNILTAGYAQVAKDSLEATDLFRGGMKKGALQAKLFGTALRSALTLGIFTAIIAAMAVIVTHWEEISDFATGVNRSLQIQLELQQKILAAQVRGSELLQTDAENALEAFEKTADLRRREGESELDLLKRRKELTEDLFLRNTGDFQVRVDNLKNEIALEEDAEERRIKRAELVNLLREQAQAALLGALDIAKLQAEIEDEIARNTFHNDVAIALETSESKVKIAEDESLAIAKIEGRTAEEREKARKEEEKLDKQSSDFKRQLAISDAQFSLQVGSQLFASLAALSAENLEAFKAFSIAKVLIDTASASLNIWTTPTTIPDPFGTAFKVAQQVAVAASSAAAINQIKNAQPSGTAVSSLTTTAPFVGLGAAANQAPPTFSSGSGDSQLASDISNAINGRPVKAFVVSTEMTTQQELDRLTQNQATW